MSAEGGDGYVIRSAMILATDSPVMQTTINRTEDFYETLEWLSQNACCL
jgi:hypothetical protein